MTRTLSGSDALTGKLSPEHAALAGEDGRPILVPWGSAVYAEAGGQIRAGGLVTSLSASGHELTVEAEGFASYLRGLPWTNTTRKYYDADPAKVASDLWRFAQMHPGGDVGVRLEPADLATPRRVGVRKPEIKDKKGETVQEAVDEPVMLARWETNDLGQVWDEMTEAGSLDYVEAHEPAQDGSIRHLIRVGYPRIGRRRTDAGFVVGVNTTTVPDVDLHVEDYASEVLVLGAGEGEKILTAHARSPETGRLRRVRVVQEKGIGRQSTADAAAEKFARQLQPHGLDVDTLQIIDHPLAPLWSINLGDEYRLTGDAWWGGKLDMWVRVLEIAHDTEVEHMATLTVARADAA